MRLGTKPKPKIAWVEGKVDRRGEHASLCFGDGERPVALVAPHERHGFTVQFMMKERRSEPRTVRVLETVRRELRFYLLDAIGPNAWSFVEYHCETPANRDSVVHWTWHPAPERK